MDSLITVFSIPTQLLSFEYPMGNQLQISVRSGVQAVIKWYVCTPLDQLYKSKNRPIPPVYFWFSWPKRVIKCYCFTVCWLFCIKQGAKLGGFNPWVCCYFASTSWLLLVKTISFVSNFIPQLWRGLWMLIYTHYENEVSQHCAEFKNWGHC